MPVEYTPAASSPPFFWYPTIGFYVFSGSYIYTQEGTDHLRFLLTYKDPGPVLNKAGKPKKHQPPPHEDKPTQFYMAQLQLYGLEPANSKEEAKKALLAAIEGPGGLVESEDVFTIRIGLAEEWRNKDVAAAAEFKEQKRLQKALRKEMKAKETKKRQRDEDESVMEVQAPSSKKSKSKEVRFRENYYIVLQCSCSVSGPQTPRQQQAIRFQRNHRAQSNWRIGDQRVFAASTRFISHRRACRQP